MCMNKQDYISALELEPHQEGGWYRQVYTSGMKFLDSISQDQRYYYTSIYFLLDDKNCSHFHRLNHDELWYFHDGSPVTIHCIAPEGDYYQVKLGKDIKNGEQFQFAVPKNTIFASEVSMHDAFGLVSCVVSPGFDYRDFELLKKATLLHLYPNYSEVIKRLAID